MVKFLRKSPPKANDKMKLSGIIVCTFKILLKTIMGHEINDMAIASKPHQLLLIPIVSTILVDFTGVLIRKLVRKLDFASYKFAYGVFTRLYQISSTHLFFSGIMSYFSNENTDFIFVVVSSSLVFLVPFIIIDSLLKLESRIIFVIYFYLSSQSMMKSLQRKKELTVFNCLFLRVLIMIMQLIVFNHIKNSLFIDF